MEERVLNTLEAIEPDIISYEGENMIADGIIDSFVIIDIVSELEDEFNLEIDAELVTIENFNNKDSIIRLIKKLIG